MVKIQTPLPVRLNKASDLHVRSVACSFIALLMFVGSSLAQDSSAPTDLGTLGFVKIRGAQATACKDGVPGKLSNTRDGLEFQPYSRFLRVPRVKRSRAKLKKFRMLNKRGRRACKESSTKKQFSYDEFGGEAALLSDSLIPSSVLGNGIVGAASGTSELRLAAFSLEEFLQALMPLFECADVSLNLLQGLTIDFGTGCQYEGIELGGSITISVTNSGSLLGLSVDYDQLTFNNASVEGDIELSLSSSGLGVEIDVNTNNNGELKQLQFSGDIRTDSSGVLLEGAGSLENSEGSSTFRIIDLHKSNDGTCYPDGGTVETTPQNGPKVKVVFDENTPSTGLVMVIVGSFPARTQSLPSCTSSL